MKEQIIDLSEQIVDIIYTPDQEKLHEMFIQLMDLLSGFLSDSVMETANLMPVLLDMQKAFFKKDYGELADVLHYDLHSILKVI